jgi:hypothetical protein
MLMMPSLALASATQRAFLFARTNNITAIIIYSQARETGHGNVTTVKMCALRKQQISAGHKMQKSAINKHKTDVAESYRAYA